MKRIQEPLGKDLQQPKCTQQRTILSRTWHMFPYSP